MSPRTIAAALLAARALAGCGSTDHPPQVARTDCNTCHAVLYDRRPDHASRGFPRECYRCHGTTRWSRAVTSHPSYPIDRSPHAGGDCADCHASEADPHSIDCTSCHAHTPGRTDIFHLGNGDYAYGPSTCLRCHAGGRR